VAEHGASGFGKEPLDKVQPGTVRLARNQGLARRQTRGTFPVRLHPKVVGGVIVKDDLDRGRGGVGGVESVEKLDEFAIAMTIPDQRVHLTREQVASETSQALASGVIAASRPVRARSSSAANTPNSAARSKRRVTVCWLTPIRRDTA